MKTYIVGHKNPDTDSIVSAIALSALEQELGKDYNASRAGDLNKETKYVLDRFGFDIPEIIPSGEKKVMLVDHNEPSQIHENVKNEEICCIFDHHKMGGLSTGDVISIRVKPIGSTSTIVAQEYRKREVEPDTKVAGILISGILSDTIKLTSPSTTDKDKKAVKYLNEFAKVDVDDLANEMFKAKSDITGVSITEIVGGDYKIFDMKGNQVGIGVSETVLPDNIMEKKEEILRELRKKKETDKLDLIFYAVVDIINQNSVLFALDGKESEVAEKAFGVKAENGLANLPGVVSRKKQIVPKIEEVL